MSAKSGSITVDVASVSPSNEETVVSLHDVSYTIPSKKKEKVILTGINGTFKKGMNAILGPTGGGKTTLLDIIAGRKKEKGLKGHVLINGQKQPENFRALSGYVVQDDVVMGGLTVRENLMFSANLRIRQDLKIQEKESVVTQVLNDLGLSHCADTLVGTQYIRGVSGGERKRTNVGMELVHQPQVLFLDEPTTGLDASTANALLVKLRGLADRGHTIIFSIHQPRYSIFKTFDQITLLAMGRLVYHGPRSESLRHFESLGHKCEEHNNPPDFFLDVINNDSTAVKNQDMAEKPKIGGRNSVAAIDHAMETSEEETFAQQLEDKFKESNIYKGGLQEIERIWKDNTDSDNTSKKNNGLSSSFWQQFRWVSKRTLTSIFRNPETYVMQICVVITFALLVGLIYLRLDKSIKYGIPNRAGAFFFIVMNQIFQNLSSVEIFIKERTLFIHENASGYYGCLAYFTSKVFCDLIPMRLQPVIFFSAISYFMIGLEVDVGKFFFFTLNLFLTTVAACSVGFFVSACVSVFAIANLAIALIFVFMMVYSGMLVKLSTVGWWFKWMKYISIFRYSLNALSINEMHDMEFCQTTNGTEYCDPQAGNKYLEAQEIAYGTTWDLWVNELALVCISLGLLVVAYIVLRLLNKKT